MVQPVLEARSFGDIVDFCTESGDGREPTTEEFLRAIKSCADGSDQTIFDYDYAPGAFDEIGLGSDIFSKMTPQQLVEAFDSLLKGARRELQETTIDTKWQGMGSVALMEMLLSGGNYVRRKQVEELDQAQSRKITNCLEQLATEHERRASDLTRYASSEKPSHVNKIFKMLEEAVSLRGMAITVTEGKLPKDYYEPKRD